MKPRRVQQKRTKGWRKPANTVYVGRPTKWGNPFAIGSELCETRADAIVLYETWLTKTQVGNRLLQEARQELQGSNLSCWCPLDEPCHADVLLRLVNDRSKNQRTIGRVLWNRTLRSFSRQTFLF